MRMRVALGLVTLAAATSVCAHEVRPAYLEITEGPGCVVLWKRPVMGERAVHLVPHLSTGALAATPTSREQTAGYWIETWSLPMADCGGLTGVTASVEGLEDTITDALVVIRRADGSSWHGMLTPAHPTRVLNPDQRSVSGATDFLRLGIEHILTGPDHLAFVLGLLLIVGQGWRLLRTITAFTVAHSITLGMAALGYARVPLPLADALIALSILFLGPEIVRRWRGETSFTIRHPWVIAFAFGLLHGFGFASGLTLVGLPRTEIPLALLMFNLGVEIGQMGFLALILGLDALSRALRIHWPRPLHALPGYVVGSMGAFWALDRIMAMVGGTR